MRLFTPSLLLILLFSNNLTAQNQSKKDIMDSLRSVGQKLVNEDEYDQAIKVFFEAIEMAEEEGYTYKVATLLSQIGLANLRNKDWDAAIDFNEQAHEKILSIQDGTNKIINITAGIKNNLALAYHRVEKYEQAMAIFKSQFNGFLLRAYDSSKTYTNMARTYVQIKQYDSALYVLGMAKPLREKINNPNHNAFAYKEYATIYNELEDYQASVDYGNKVLTIGLELDNSGHVEDGYRNLRDAYFNWGKFRESAEYGQKYAEFISEIHDLERDEIISEMQTKYNVAKKDHEIEELRYQQIIDEKARITLIIVIISIVLVTLLLIFSFRNRLRKQQVEKELTETQLELKEKELVEKQEELNHFVNVVQEKNKLIEAFESQSALGENKSEDLLPKLYESVILTEEDWENFKEMFENVYDNFFSKLKSTFPSISTSEMRLSALMKLNLSTKEISSMLGISPDSVTKAKYRIKKKIEVEDSKQLTELILNI